MATTIQEFASPKETELALAHLIELQENPNLLEGFFSKYPESNPFVSWPLRRKPTLEFLLFFEKNAPRPEQSAEPGAPFSNTIDAKQLNALVDEFNKEIEEARTGKLRASDAAKKFVSALKENAKKANAPLPEIQAPLPPEPESAPITVERVQQIISATINHIGPPEEKVLVFHALTAFSSQQPNKDITQLVPRAVAVSENARVFSSPQEIFPKERSFVALASNDFQKSVARAMDAVVSPAIKEVVVNKMLLKPLETIVNRPEAVPKKLMDEMVSRWGENFVKSSWFNQLRLDTNRLMGDQRGAVKIKSGLTNFVSDVATAVFRGPLDNNSFALNNLVLALNKGVAPKIAGATTTHYNIISYIETYRLIAMQGAPTISVSHYNNMALGYGSQLVRVGANYAMRAGIRAGIKKAAAGTAVKVGVEALAGAGTGGLATLAMMGADLLKGVVNKGVAALKSLLFMGSSKRPEDNLLLIVGACIALVFFIPIFPLFNLPAFNQSMIDTSIANSTGGGPENVNQYLDLSITASPEIITGALPVTVTYTACIKPKGNPSSFTINRAGVTFSIYGGVGTPSLNAIVITTGMLSDGCYSFNTSVNTQFNNSVITAILAVNADVGEILDVDGSTSVSVVVGNPPTGCFVFGDAGFSDAYGHTSTTWDNKAGILAAIGELARSPQYMGQVCAGGPVTLYRVSANYGGGSVTPPSSIFFYNGGVTSGATYTLAHETGHVVNARTGLFSQYNSLALYAREGPLWTYPNGFSEGEDFAETLGAYVVWRSYVWSGWHGHAAGKLDYTGQYPLHYQFAKGVFGIEY